jgi:hypothetical protein
MDTEVKLLKGKTKTNEFQQYMKGRYLPWSGGIYFRTISRCI